MTDAKQTEKSKKRATPDGATEPPTAKRGCEDINISIPRVLLEWITSPRLLLVAMLADDDMAASQIAGSAVLCPDPNAIDPKGLRLPLVTACIRDLPLTVAALLHRGADPLLTDFSGRDAVVASFDVTGFNRRGSFIKTRDERSPLAILGMLAGALKSPYGDRRLRFLISCHADDWDNEPERVVRRASSRIGSVVGLRFLISCHADDLDNEPERVVRRASSRIGSVVAWPCYMHASENKASTALYRACRYGQIGVVPTLISKFGLTSAGSLRRGGKSNVLTKATLNLNTDCTRFLLSIGAEMPPNVALLGAHRAGMITEQLKCMQPLPGVPTVAMRTHNYRLLPQLWFASGLVREASPVCLLSGFPDILRFICAHSRSIAPPGREEIPELN
jgi:hypothetical protein